MRIKVKKLHDDAVLPKKAHGSDFCFDVVATSVKEIAPHIYQYGIGLAFEIVRPHDMDNSNLSIDVRPRSSCFKNGMMMINSIGTVDEDYRGEVKLTFWHFRPEFPRYEVGNRIGQIKVGIAPKAHFEWAEELSDTERGTGGHGSTGK